MLRTTDVVTIGASSIYSALPQHSEHEINSLTALVSPLLLAELPSHQVEEAQNDHSGH